LCADRTEVTVAAYAECVNANYCRAEDLGCDGAANWGRPDRSNHPINCVSALQAEVYCSWKKARLPTAEEYSAMASPPHRAKQWYPWGEPDPDDDGKHRACWSGGENARSGTCAVGSFPSGAGRGGILDAVGNVWEWTSTVRRNDRVFMGGAWNEKTTRKLAHDSSNHNSPSSHFEDVGFRCVHAVVH
jgi:formylglycine-generating enzyme required for sulfatase activity